MVRDICVVTPISQKVTNDLMQMLDLEETIDQLARSKSVLWHGHVLRKDTNVHHRKPLDFRAMR